MAPEPGIPLTATDAGPLAPNPTRWMFGDADAFVISEALGTAGLYIVLVQFEPGTRTRPHSHTEDQVLYYTSGEGVYAIDGGPDQTISAGQFVLLPAGVMHIHGAADGAAAEHLSMMRPATSNFDQVPAVWQHLKA